MKKLFYDFTIRIGLPEWSPEKWTAVKAAVKGHAAKRPAEQTQKLEELAKSE